MSRQYHEAVLDAPMAEVFTALVGVVAHGRWDRQAFLEPGAASLPVGTRYEQQRGAVLRRGRVVECIRPVSITLQESLLEAPCQVELKLRWRLNPGDSGSLLRLDVRYRLTGAAVFRKEHWDRRIAAHCQRMLAKLEQALAGERGQESGVSGQSTGSSSIATTKVKNVSGKPSFMKSLNR